MGKRPNKARSLTEEEEEVLWEVEKFGSKAGAVKVKHDLPRNILQVNQSKTSGTNLSHWNPREKRRRLHRVTSSCCSWRNALW